LNSTGRNDSDKNLNNLNPDIKLVDIKIKTEVENCDGFGSMKEPLIFTSYWWYLTNMKEATAVNPNV
jgi:hypothetical protein